LADPALSEQLNHTLAETHLDALGERYRGKVRDVYRQRDRLFLVATDRLSAFDRVLTTVPFKGEVLNRIAQFWFDKTKDIVPNHVLDTPDPNVTVARATKPFPVEVVDIFRNVEAIPAIVDEAIAKGARVVWMQEGLAEPASAQKAREAGLRVVMDRCMKKDHAHYLA